MMNDPQNNTLWERTVTALDRGDFTLLDDMLKEQEVSLIELLEAKGEPIDEMNEAFAFACMIGRTEDAEALLDKGVDPYAGMKTWLAGPHWAVSGGNLDTVKMLARRQIPLEVENKYGGTVLGQALWSAVEEYKPSHPEIIQLLIDAGAVVEPGTLEWWNDQNVPNGAAKEKVASTLREHFSPHSDSNNDRV